MKKLAIIAAVMLSAIITQAAAFSWTGSTETTNPNSAYPGYTGPNSSFYLVFLGGTDYTFGNGGWDITTSQPASGTIVGTYGAGSGYDYSNGKVSFVFSADESVINGFYALLSIDNLVNDTYGAYQFQVTGLTNTGSAPAFDAGSLDAGAFETVPEPTSMALLGLGIAAFGLRRKFRK